MCLLVNVRAGDSRLGLVGLLLHDVQDHATGGGAALWSGVDGDGLFCRTGIFLPMNVHPERRRETSKVKEPKERK